jgi:hypothetical protein
MKWKNAVHAVVLIMVMIGMSFAAAGRAAEDAPRITKEEVKALLEDPGVVTLDARTGASWTRKSRARSGSIPTTSRPGPAASPWTRRSSSIAPERTKERAPVWCSSSRNADSRTHTPSRADGTNGRARGIRSRTSDRGPRAAVRSWR